MSRRSTLRRRPARRVTSHVTISSNLPVNVGALRKATIGALAHRVRRPLRPRHSRAGVAQEDQAEREVVHRRLPGDAGRLDGRTRRMHELRLHAYATVAAGHHAVGNVPGEHLHDRSDEQSALLASVHADADDSVEGFTQEVAGREGMSLLGRNGMFTKSFTSLRRFSGHALTMMLFCASSAREQRPRSTPAVAPQLRTGPDASQRLAPSVGIETASTPSATWLSVD